MVDPYHGLLELTLTLGELMLLAPSLLTQRSKNLRRQWFRVAPYFL